MTVLQSPPIYGVKCLKVTNCVHCTIDSTAVTSHIWCEVSQSNELCTLYMTVLQSPPIYGVMLLHSDSIQLQY